MTADPALRFWLGWAETEGALHEAAGDSTLVVLPRRLQVALGFGEEVAVTADPEVAREDRTLLLAHGHPALDHATSEVLARGDVGRLILARPGSVPPDADALLARARDAFPVDHGRIDLAGAPVVGHRAVLRVGALLTHSVSLEDRFGEVAEVWVDVPTGLALPGAVRDRVAAAGHADVENETGLPAELSTALEAVHRLLEDGATARRAALAREIVDARGEELERIRSYFDAALATIRKRRDSAAADRRHLYDARAEATRGERARRLVEVEEKWRPRTEVRPFRLHLLSVPSLVVPVHVRRGPRNYPSTLEWLLSAAAFAPLRCPHCASAVRPGTPALVAGKHRLGCESCLVSAAGEQVRPTLVAPATPSKATGAEPPRRDTSRGIGASTPAVVPPPVATPVRAAAQRTEPGRTARRGAAPAIAAARRTAAAPRTAPAPASVPPLPASRPASSISDVQRSAAVGEKLAFDFWRLVADGDSRRLRRLIAPDSPLAALVAVSGVDIPARIVGLAPAEMPLSVTSQSAEVAVPPQVVWGEVVTRRARYPYSLRWELMDGRPLAVELLAVAVAVGRRLPMLRAWQDRIPDGSDKPRNKLDPVAATLWRTVRPRYGPLLAGRCLAAWWRAKPDLRLAAHPDDAVAAAVHHKVARRAGEQSTYAELAGLHQVDEQAVRRAATVLQAVLQLSENRCW